MQMFFVGRFDSAGEPSWAWLPVMVGPWFTSQIPKSSAQPRLAQPGPLGWKHVWSRPPCIGRLAQGLKSAVLTDSHLFWSTAFIYSFWSFKNAQACILLGSWPYLSGSKHWELVLADGAPPRFPMQPESTRWCAHEGTQVFSCGSPPLYSTTNGWQPTRVGYPMSNHVLNLTMIDPN